MVGALVVAGAVVGAKLVGAAVVGAKDVGARVVGTREVGANVVGATVVAPNGTIHCGDLIISSMSKGLLLKRILTWVGFRIEGKIYTYFIHP